MFMKSQLESKISQLNQQNHELNLTLETLYSDYINLDNEYSRKIKKIIDISENADFFQSQILI